MLLYCGFYGHSYPQAGGGSRSWLVFEKQVEQRNLGGISTRWLTTTCLDRTIIGTLFPVSRLQNTVLSPEILCWFKFMVECQITKWQGETVCIAEITVYWILSNVLEFHQLAGYHEVRLIWIHVLRILSYVRWQYLCLREPCAVMLMLKKILYKNFTRVPLSENALQQVWTEDVFSRSSDDSVDL